MTKSKARKWMKANIAECVDGRTGEVDYTLLVSKHKG